jgi:hypothetical protein
MKDTLHTIGVSFDEFFFQTKSLKTEYIYK